MDLFKNYLRKDPRKGRCGGKVLPAADTTTLMTLDDIAYVMKEKSSLGDIQSVLTILWRPWITTLYSGQFRISRTSAYSARRRVRQAY